MESFATIRSDDDEKPLMHTDSMAYVGTAANLVRPLGRPGRNPANGEPIALLLHGGGNPEPESLKESIRELISLTAIIVSPICPPSPDGDRYTN